MRTVWHGMGQWRAQPMLRLALGQHLTPPFPAPSPSLGTDRPLARTGPILEPNRGKGWQTGQKNTHLLARQTTLSLPSSRSQGIIWGIRPPPQNYEIATGMGNIGASWAVS